MKVTARRQRMLMVLAIVIGVGLAVSLGLRAFQENLLYFYSTSQVHKGEAPLDRKFRLGGIVVQDTVERERGSLTVRFVLTDTETTVPVEYAGILPDLFREGQGIVTHGRLNDNGVFIADEVLAKHDEEYMPPEVAASIKQAHYEGVKRAREQEQQAAKDAGAGVKE